jgi:hypothetical protein
MIIDKIEINNQLNDKFIFLSVSLPSADRHQNYYLNTNPLNITNAVVSFIESILKRNGKIIFGGHPTISPLVLTVAKKFISILNGEKDPVRIYIYQSEMFKDKISKFTNELLDLGIGKIIWTESFNDLREKSLYDMRVQMLKQHNISAGIFIGGMEGIEEEFDLFKEIYPETPMYLIGSSGGATKILFEKYFKDEKEWVFPWDYNIKELKNELYKSKIYPSLAKLVMNDIISR